MTTSALTAFEARNDLKIYGDNALLLFALEMRFRIDDIHSVAITALTDSNDDKKCDLVYVDVDEGYAVVAQGYFATTPKKEAKANKASDLNTAVGWLLTPSIEDIPEKLKLRSAAIELRNALENNQISSLQFWYVHNLPESQNVENELQTVENTAYSALGQNFPKTEVTEITAQEIGLNALETWHKSQITPILVSDTIEIDIPGGYEEEGEDWAAFVTSVSAEWIHEQFQRYKSELWSANIRGYLGSFVSRRSINNGMRETASDDPSHFWVYNNGITAIVHEYKKEKGKLIIDGISIVNGAQTTGAIGTLENIPNPSARVAARFIKCDNPATIQNIIRYNNTQNRVEAPDFRSNDPIQQRLVKEFRDIPDALYSGGRRGSEEDIIRKKPDELPSGTVAQALAAFHQDPGVAYTQKSDIWIVDSLYANYFSDNTTAEHIVLAYSLLKSVQNRKLWLKNNQSSLTDAQQQELEFLTFRGAILVFTSAIAACLEIFADRKISNTFRISFGKTVSPQTAQKIWESIVITTAPFAARILSPVVEKGVSRPLAKRQIGTFTELVNATSLANAIVFEAFSKNLKFH